MADPLLPTNLPAPAPATPPPPINLSNTSTLPASGSTALTPGITDPIGIDSTNIGAYEFQAQALNQASITAYGTPMNPQVLLELLKTGASNATLGAIASGDPEFASLLSAAPAGMSPRLANSNQSAVGLNLGNDQQLQSLYNFDAQTMKNLQAAAGHSDDAQIRALGEVPIMNLGYISGVKSSKDVNRIKSWQTFLKDRGLMTKDFQPTGVWDANSLQAFSGFIVASFMPEALFGNNQAQARIFMNEMGANVDDLIKSQGRDGLQKDTFLKWLQTQDQSHARAALSTYVGKYGQGSIPDSYKNLTGSWIDSFQDTLSSIPILGNVLSPIENIFSINKLDTPTDIFKDNRSVREDYALKSLNPNEKQALESIAQDAKHSVGWFGALDGWDRSRTRMVLGLLWDFHDHGLNIFAYHNPVSNFTNSFDVSTDYGKRIATGQTDLFGNLPVVGSWFNQHETLKGITNFTANIFDDPTSYTGVGFIGKGAFKATSALHDYAQLSETGSRIVSATDKVWVPFTAKDWILGDFARSAPEHTISLIQRGLGKEVILKRAWDLFARDHLDQVIVNKRNVQAVDEMAHVMMNKDVFQHDMANLLSIGGTDSPDVEKKMRELQNLTRSKGTPEEIHDKVVTFLSENFGHEMMDPGFAYNYYEALRGITPVMAKRMSLGRMQRLLAHGSQALKSPIVDTRRPLQVMENITSVGHALGMKPGEIQPFIKKVEEAGGHPDHISDVVMDFGKHIAKTFDEHPEWSKIEFDGKTGLEAFNAWQRKSRINPADDPISEIGQGAQTAYAPKEIKDAQGKGTGMAAEQSTASATGARVQVKDAIQIHRAMVEKAHIMLDTLAHVMSPEEMTALGYHGEIDEVVAGKAVVAFRHKMEATVDPVQRQEMAPVLRALEADFISLKTFSEKLGQVAPDGQTVAAAAFTSQLRYMVPMFATPAEILSYTHPILRNMESAQQFLKLDSMRSFWSQAEIARISSAFRITTGDEVMRFFFAMLMNGQTGAAFRYLGTMMAGIPLKAGRKMGITTKGFHEVTPELASSAMGLAGLSAGAGHALHHPGTPWYNKALARAIWYTFGKDKFTQEWLQHYGKHIDISQELMDAEKKWYGDHAASQAHLDTAAKMMEDRGLTEQAKQLQALRDGAVKDRSPVVKDSAGKEYVPEFASIRLDKLGGEFRQGLGDNDLINQLERVQKYRQVNDLEELRAMMIDKEIAPHYIDILDEEFKNALKAHEIGLEATGLRKELLDARTSGEPDKVIKRLEKELAALEKKRGAVGGPGIDTHDLRSTLGNYNQEKATRMLHRQILLTDKRAAAYTELAAELRKETPDLNHKLADIWSEWSKEMSGGATHAEVADMIDGFLGRNNNRETISDMNRLRNRHNLNDLQDGRPMGRIQGDEMLAAHRNIASAIRTTLAQPDLSEDQLVALGNWIREADPKIGQWHGTDLARHARVQLGSSENIVRQLSKDPRYFGYMSAGNWAERQHSILADIMSHPQMMKWVKQVTDMKHEGATKLERDAAEMKAQREWTKTFEPELKRIIKPNSLNHDNLSLPWVAQPLATHENMRGLRRFSQQYFDWMHHSVTGAMVGYARQVGMETIRAQRLQLLERVHPEWFRDGRPMHEAEWRANAYAMAWVRKNTYQGQRTVMGGVMRNAFPFWGATANMSRFWMRQVSQHKHWQAPFFHSMSWVDQTQANGGLHLSLPFTNWMMSKVTGNQGEDITLDPLKPFFFTSDGIGGFVPGMGPFLSLPLDQMASHDPQVVDSAMQAFGPLGDVWRQHIQGSVSNPLLSWTPGVLEGAFQLTGNTAPEIPFLTDTAGQQTRDVLARTREQQAQRDDQGVGASADPQADVTSAVKSVGLDNEIKGLFSFLLPIGLKTQDNRAVAVSDQLAKWDATPDSQRNKLLATAFGVDPNTMDASFQNGDVVKWATNNPQNPANLLLYFDRKTSEDDKRSISFVAPWVVSYATSKYDATKNAPQVYSNAQEFGQAVDAGNIHTMDPGDYIRQINKNRQFNQAWAMYGLLKQKEYEWMRETGNTSQSQAAKTYREHFFNPQFSAIASAYPDWANQFASQSRKDLQGLLVSTRPIRSVMSWEVIPQFGEMDTKKTALWRQVFRDREDAVTAIREARKSGSSSLKTTELQVLSDFQQRLVQYAQMDPSFAAELDQFHYGRIEDLINLEAMGEQ